MGSCQVIANKFVHSALSSETEAFAPPSPPRQNCFQGHGEGGRATGDAVLRAPDAIRPRRQLGLCLAGYALDEIREEVVKSDGAAPSRQTIAEIIRVAADRGDDPCDENSGHAGR